MALVKLNEVEFGGYECVSEIDDEASFVVVRRRK